MDKLSGDLRRCLARDHSKTTWKLDDLFTVLKRELQVLEQDKTKEVNKCNPIRQQPFTTTKHKVRKKKQHRTGYGKKDYTGQKKPAAECSFCGSSHRASDCLKYTNVNDRLEVAERKGL